MKIKHLIKISAICIVPPDGHARTIEAITIASEMRGTSGGIGDRFQPIVQGLLVRNEQVRLMEFIRLFILWELSIFQKMFIIFY